MYENIIISFNMVNISYSIHLKDLLFV